ncbi:MAG: hypothetical protein AB7F66_17720 [Bacteriovoracia bacterium]
MKHKLKFTDSIYEKFIDAIHELTNEPGLILAAIDAEKCGGKCGHSACLPLARFSRTMREIVTTAQLETIVETTAKPCTS